MVKNVAEFRTQDSVYVCVCVRARARACVYVRVLQYNQDNAINRSLFGCFYFVIFLHNR